MLFIHFSASPLPQALEHLAAKLTDEEASRTLLERLLHLFNRLGVGGGGGEGQRRGGWGVTGVVGVGERGVIFFPVGVLKMDFFIF